MGPGVSGFRFWDLWTRFYLAGFQGIGFRVSVVGVSEHAAQGLGFLGFASKICSLCYVSER